MPGFVPENMPTSVDTLEKVAAWSLGALYQLYKNEKYPESDGSPLVPFITAQDGLAADKKEHIIFRISLELSDDWRSKSSKFWQEIQPYPGGPSIPTSFLP